MGSTTLRAWEQKGMDTMLSCATVTLAVALSVVAPGLPLGGEVRTSEGPVPVGPSEPKTSFATISSDQLAEKLGHKDFVFINVHIPYEGEIAQTDAFIPFDKIAENLDRLPKDRSAAIVLYCRSGRMSEIAATDLAARGFTRVSHVSGGMIDWQGSGRPVLHK